MTGIFLCDYEIKCVFYVVGCALYSVFQAKRFKTIWKDDGVCMFRVVHLDVKLPSNVIWPGLVMSLSCLSDSLSAKDVTLESGGLYTRCKWFDSCGPLFLMEKTSCSRFGVHQLFCGVAFISYVCIIAIPPPILFGWGRVMHLYPRDRCSVWLACHLV